MSNAFTCIFAARLIYWASFSVAMISSWVNSMSRFVDTLRAPWRVRSVFTLHWLLLCFLAVPLGAAAQGQRESNTTVYLLQPLVTDVENARLSFFDHPHVVRPKIGIALSGGGSRCLSHIGVLQVLTENQIPIDYIAGTSMGSILGGLFAAGYDPWELERIAKSIDWNSILVDRPPRRNLFISKKQERDRLLFQIRFDGLKPHIPRALSPGQRIQSIFTELTMQANYVSGISFDDLRIPFRAVCTDLYSGDKVVLSEGDLAEAMRASMAVPLLFTPVPWQGKLLVDGGLLDNIPVDAVREFPVDLVIAIDASSGLRRKGDLNAPWEIADQVTTIMQQDRNASSRHQADLVIDIDRVVATNMDFSKIDSLILAGRAAAHRMLPAIRHQIERVTQMMHSHLAYPDIKITRIEFVPPAMRERFATARNGHSNSESHSVPEIVKLLETMMATGTFRRVYAEVTARGVCTIHAEPNPILHRVDFFGNTTIPDDTLRKFFVPLLGKPINHVATERASESILGLYRKQGYSLARITEMTFDSTDGRGTLFINEGRISSILVSGLERTRRHVVEREFPQKPGDRFNFRRAQKGVENIYSTGLFEAVSLSLSRHPEGAAVQLKLQEKKYTALGLSARIDTERKSRAFIEFADENLAGIGAKFVLHGQYGHRDRGAQSRFSLDRIFRTYLTLNAQAAYNYERNYLYDDGALLGQYDLKRFGASVSVGQLVKRLGILSVELHSDRFWLESVFGEGYPVGTSVISRLVFRSMLDTRDELPFPTRGRFVHVFYELSNKLLNQQLSRNDSFFRFLATVETVNTFATRHTFQPRFTIGTADLTTPFELHFRLGGPDHIIGLRDHELTGRHFLLANFAYRFKVPEFLPFKTYLGLRYDVGGMWDNAEKLNYDEVLHAAGVSLGMDTFLGALEVAYGRVDTGTGRFYLSIGHRF